MASRTGSNCYNMLSRRTDDDRIKHSRGDKIIAENIADRDNIS